MSPAPWVLLGPCRVWVYLLWWGGRWYATGAVVRMMVPSSSCARGDYILHRRSQRVSPWMVYLLHGAWYVRVLERVHALAGSNARVVSTTCIGLSPSSASGGPRVTVVCTRMYAVVGSRVRPSWGGVEGYTRVGNRYGEPAVGLVSLALPPLAYRVRASAWASWDHGVRPQGGVTRACKGREGNRRVVLRVVGAWFCMGTRVRWGL